MKRDWLLAMVTDIESEARNTAYAEGMDDGRLVEQAAARATEHRATLCRHGEPWDARCDESCHEPGEAPEHRATLDVERLERAIHATFPHLHGPHELVPNPYYLERAAEVAAEYDRLSASPNPEKETT